MNYLYTNRRSVGIFGGLLLLILFSCCGIGRAAAQQQGAEQRITLSMRDTAISDILENITKRYQYAFITRTANVDTNARVSIDVVDEPLRAVLDRIFAGQEVAFEFDGRLVRISKAAVPPPSSAKPVKAEKTISGRVTAVSGEPIVGASVIVKGTSIGNVTGISGEYTISAEPEQTLSFAFLGYDTKEVKVGSRTTIDVTLTEQNKQISEVVVVGYAPMRKSDFTGSIASVKSSELSVTAPTVGQSLAGKVAGVEVHQTSGAPGDGVTIRVRGVNSLSASSDPLYVIDGYPASEDVFINPNDIESIDILKDAASAAIYGSRGASGVVLITTKRGKEGEAAKVSYDFSYGIQQLDHKVDLLNAVQFRDLLIDARNNSYRLRATAAGVSWSPYDDNTVRAAKGFSLAEVGIPSMFYDFTTRTPVTPQYDTECRHHASQRLGDGRFEGYQVHGQSRLHGSGRYHLAVEPQSHQRPPESRRADHQAAVGESQLFDVRCQEPRGAGRGPHDQRRRDPERPDVSAEPSGLRGER